MLGSFVLVNPLIHIMFKLLFHLTTRCGWVKNHCLMALCKLEHLRELSLRGCHRVGECFAYTALATR